MCERMIMEFELLKIKTALRFRYEEYFFDFKQIFRYSSLNKNKVFRRKNRGSIFKCFSSQEGNPEVLKACLL